MDWRRLRWFIAGIAALPFIIVGVIILRIAGLISSIPVVLGRRVSVEDMAMKVVYRIVDIDRVHRFRDDLLYILEERYRWSEEFDADLDRWSLLRQIDLNLEATKKHLREGEFVLSLGGGLLSVVIGGIYGFRLAGIVLALVILFFSVLVVLRVVITEVLSYDSLEVRDEPLEKLILIRGWNAVQVNHSTALILATFLFSISSSDLGYNLGLEFTDWFGRNAAPFENDRWRAEDE